MSKKWHPATHESHQFLEEYRGDGKQAVRTDELSAMPVRIKGMFDTRIAGMPAGRKLGILKNDRLRIANIAPR